MNLSLPFLFTVRRPFETKQFAGFIKGRDHIEAWFGNLYLVIDLPT